MLGAMTIEPSRTYGRAASTAPRVFVPDPRALARRAAPMPGPTAIAGVLAAALLLYAPSAAAKGPASANVKPVISATETSSGQPIVFPTGPGQVVVSIVEIAPGAALPVHKHPFPRYGYVLEGSLRVVNDESGKALVFNPGDFLLETVGQWHHGINAGNKILRLLVIDLVEKGHADNTVLK